MGCLFVVLLVDVQWSIAATLHDVFRSMSAPANSVQGLAFFEDQATDITQRHVPGNLSETLGRLCQHQR